MRFAYHHPILGRQELKEENMPDTGEDREIRQRVNAKETEIVSESKKLVQRSKPTKIRPDRGNSMKKKTRKDR